MALASPVELPKPTIFSLLNSKPSAFENSYIASAASAGRAVSTNKSSLPLASLIFLATSNNGPRPRDRDWETADAIYEFSKAEGRI